MHDIIGFSIQDIATESSAQSVHIQNASSGVIHSIHSNPNPNYSTPPAGTSTVYLDQTGNDISLEGIGQSPTYAYPTVIDNSVPDDANGLPRSFTYSPVGGRGSYFQSLDVYNALLSNITATNISATNLSAGNITGSGAGLTNVPAAALTGVTSASFQSEPTVPESANYTLANTDRGTRQVFSSNAGATATLGTPSATQFVNGWYFLVSNTGLAPMNVAAPSGHTIDGQASISIAPHTLAVITSDGTNYFSSLAGSGNERLIDYYELAQNTASISFTIPPGFHHLHLLSSCKTTSTNLGPILAQLNGDMTPSHYSRQSTVSYGTTVIANSSTTDPGLCVAVDESPTDSYWASTDAIISLGGTTSTPTGSVTALSMCSYHINSVLYAEQNAGQWSGAGPITSMVLVPETGSFYTGCTFYLYGY